MKTYFVDSFTNEPFKGNPAGVCLLNEELDDHKLQEIATEIGFSETAFVRPNGGTYRIRYFSPKKEIPLCGHATLASAKILFEKENIDQVVFVTHEHVELSVRKEADGILMEFPVYDTADMDVPPEVLKALGLEHPEKVSFSPKNRIILVEIDDAGRLAALKPNFPELVKSYEGINGVLVTAPSDTKDYDFHYRYFWPWAGTNEDPVTGGVQTFLTKYWAQKLGKNRMKAFQSSQRTGEMTVEWKGDKVLILGNAVIVFEGNLKL